MRFASLFIGGLLAIASAHPIFTVEKRDAAGIVGSLKAIQTNIALLNTTIGKFEGSVKGIFKLHKIRKRTKRVSRAIQAATRVTEATNFLTEAESQKVAEGVLAVKADLDTFLPFLESKKDAFDTVGIIFSVRETVLKSLKKQKAQSLSLGAAISAKLTGPLAGYAPLINAQIAQRFDQAIQTYSTTGGIIDLPGIPG